MKKTKRKRAKKSADIGAAATSIVVAATTTPYAIAVYIRAISDGADRLVVPKLARLLAGYGHAEFTRMPAHAVLHAPGE
jgi:hypothetical protein